MIDYEKLYTVTFNALTQISQIAEKAQQEAEELYLKMGDEEETKKDAD